MDRLFVQIVILVGMSQGLRALGRLVGPRRCGWLAGLPSTTALMLLFCGHDHGVGEALASAESCLLGVVAAAALPLAYVRAIGAGSRWIWAAASAVAAYVAVASGSRLVPEAGPLGRVAISAVGVLAACRLAGRVRGAGGVNGPSPEERQKAGLRPLALAAAVPSGLLVTVRLLRALGGAAWAGLFTTFPAMSLAVLMTTHLESGPSAASRIARAMPAGNLIMIAFLTAFRFAGPRMGLGWGTALGYAPALATLLALEGSVRPVSGPRAWPWSAPRPGHLAFRRYGPIEGRWPRHRMRFSPRIEALPIYMKGGGR